MKIKPFLLVALVALLPDASPRAADFDIKNASEFKTIVPAEAKLKKLAGGMKFLEGPVWVAKDPGYLIFSNIPDNELKKWSEEDGLRTFRTDTHSGNGNCVDLEGRLITCEAAGRRLTLTEKDGSFHTLVDQIGGKKFNAPNDVVVKSDGTIWFSDPDYGLGSKPREVPGMYVYRLDPRSGAISAVVKDCHRPNGLCFSPDEKLLYVGDSGDPHDIRVYDVRGDGTVANGRLFCVVTPGVPDGIRCDYVGRIFSSAGDGVQIFGLKGDLIGKILVPETPANLCFGGKNRNILFITACSSLYSIPLSTSGVY